LVPGYLGTAPKLREGGNQGRVLTPFDLSVNFVLDLEYGTHADSSLTVELSGARADV
jgi:hypothetical protein